MRIEEALHRIQEPACIEPLQPRWADSQKTLPETIPFLDPQTFTTYRAFAGLEPTIGPILAETAATIRSDEALRSLIWHCYRTVFDYEAAGEPWRQFSQWPGLRPVLGKNAGVFYLLVALAMVPKVRARHEEMGIDPEITQQTCRQVRSFCLNYRKGHDGYPGVFRRQIYWLRHHVDGHIFRIGRLEYYLTTFEEYRGACDVYRHRHTGAVVALAREGVSFDAAGHVASPFSAASVEEGWTATRTESVDSVRGTPISPYGRACREELTLATDIWDRVLGPENTVLSMHIPAGDSLTPDRFVSSMRAAVAFFRTHFPDQPPAAIACGSWIFGYQIDEILPQSTNLVRNMREVYLLPTPKREKWPGLWFIFCYDDEPEREDLPASTTLERAVVDCLAAGGDWREGGMFFLTTDLHRFGSRFYRAHWPPEELARSMQ